MLISPTHPMSTAVSFFTQSMSWMWGLVSAFILLLIVFPLFMKVSKGNPRLWVIHLRPQSCHLDQPPSHFSSVTFSLFRKTFSRHPLSLFHHFFHTKLQVGQAHSQGMEDLGCVKRFDWAIQCRNENERLCCCCGLLVGTVNSCPWIDPSDQICISLPGYQAKMKSVISIHTFLLT